VKPLQISHVPVQVLVTKLFILIVLCEPPNSSVRKDGRLLYRKKSVRVTLDQGVPHLLHEPKLRQTADEENCKGYEDVGGHGSIQYVVSFYPRWAMSAIGRKRNIHFREKANSLR
jgi:hypothetical protein